MKVIKRTSFHADKIIDTKSDDRPMWSYHYVKVEGKEWIPIPSGWEGLNLVKDGKWRVGNYLIRDDKGEPVDIVTPEQFEANYMEQV